MSALSAIEAAEFDEVAARRGARLRLVSAPRPADGQGGGTRPAGVSRASSAPRAGVSRASSAPRAGLPQAVVAAPTETARPVPGTPAAPPGRAAAPGLRPTARSAPGPLRLTRRGRLVVAAFMLLIATIAITVASMTISGAQAANHGRPGAGYAGMHQVVVQPGQTLWSIAVRAEPAADPRQVVAQIMTANGMTSSAVQAGELLWVPR
jgi:LysM domain